MSDDNNANDSKVQQVYAASSLNEQQQVYDNWANDYEAELYAMGYCIPAQVATTFCHVVNTTAGDILDAGCGGGMQSEPLAMLGYGPITGIDLSPGMLAIARRKNIYQHLETATLGETLRFADNHFGAVLTCGTITQNHAPPHSFKELIRVAKPNAKIVFALRNDSGIDTAYAAMVQQLSEQNLWRQCFSSQTYQTMPYGEPEITHRIHVYEVC